MFAFLLGSFLEVVVEAVQFARKNKNPRAALELLYLAEMREPPEAGRAVALLRLVEDRRAGLLRPDLHCRLGTVDMARN